MDASACEKHFDTSGKSGALFHHRAICKTAHDAAQRALGAITGQKFRPLKLHRRMIACALPYRARLPATDIHTKTSAGLTSGPHRPLRQTLSGCCLAVKAPSISRAKAA